VLTVRRADASDVAALRVVANEAYRDYVPRIGRQPAPMTADYAEAVRGGLAWAAWVRRDAPGRAGRVPARLLP
jgi:hypothetical protein